MDFARSQINEVLNYYKEISNLITDELYSLPDGRLLVFKSAGRTSFQHALHEDGKYCRHGIGKDKPLIRKLARKEFLRTESKLMNRNIDQLDRAIKNTSDIDAASIIKAMRKGYRELPEEMFFQEESFTLTHKLTGEDRLRIQRHVEWGNAPYEEYNGYPQNKNKLTSFGKRVRTRGEQLIADSLHYVGVPNRYEEVLRIGPYVMAPDFTFRDCNMKPFYWEYAGMMDDPAYEQRHQIKLKQYREVGIVPWKNLIVTYDTHGSINMAMVEATIMNDIIPRL